MDTRSSSTARPKASTVTPSTVTLSSTAPTSNSPSTFSNVLNAREWAPEALQPSELEEACWAA